MAEQLRQVDTSTLLTPTQRVIEFTVTDTRGYEPLPRVRYGDIEDSLALQEMLGRMKVSRSDVIYRSTAEDWSFVNLKARFDPRNVDTEDCSQKLPLLIIARDPNQMVGEIISGNIINLLKGVKLKSFPKV